jgi:hypothetical protein
VTHIPPLLLAVTKDGQLKTFEMLLRLFAQSIIDGLHQQTDFHLGN